MSKNLHLFMSLFRHSLPTHILSVVNNICKMKNDLSSSYISSYHVRGLVGWEQVNTFMVNLLIIPYDTIFGTSLVLLGRMLS